MSATCQCGPRRRIAAGCAPSAAGSRAASVGDGIPERADQQANRKRRGQADGKRVRLTEDARGYNAILTGEGFARLEEAWPTNLASVRRHLLDHLSGRHLKKLAVALSNIARARLSPARTPLCRPVLLSRASTTGSSGVQIRWRMPSTSACQMMCKKHPSATTPAVAIDVSLTMSLGDFKGEPLSGKRREAELHSA
ncbi:hypothetical protein [Streptomyces sp. NPDC052015]|uniref:hypothetical protein n=1 Tax=Streptomyces sp. NPDC052015 TaxID=3154755 RepID=UPI003445F8E2